MKHINANAMRVNCILWGRSLPVFSHPGTSQGFGVPPMDKKLARVVLKQLLRSVIFFFSVFWIIKVICAHCKKLLCCLGMWSVQG